MAEEKAIKEKVRKEENLIRILSTDLPAEKKVYSALTRIKGISWSFSNAICYKLGIDKNKKIQELSEKEIEDISKFAKNPELPIFLFNRKKELETGENHHLITSDLDLKHELEIKKLKKIKSYKGVRHILGQPVRGQRTKSHFRKNKTLGVRRKAKGETGK
ncbi:MAG: 30S ribosomal protein S13 [Candidatus Pacearchaeota archaeon]|nr:30S ribosomal protein S13 [Candidatus Pacearchaeota archaeon]